MQVLTFSSSLMQSSGINSYAVRWWNDRNHTFQSLVVKSI